MKIDARWEASDGYVGKSRPQHTILEIEDFFGYAHDSDIEMAIYDAVEEDFRNKVTFAINNIDELIKKIREAEKED